MSTKAKVTPTLALHLLDPGAALALAKDVYELVHDGHRGYIWVSKAGELKATRWKMVVNKHGSLLGKFYLRPKRKEVAVRGWLLLGIQDELREAFEQLNMKAVFPDE